MASRPRSCWLGNLIVFGRLCDSMRRRAETTFRVLCCMRRRVLRVVIKALSGRIAGRTGHARIEGWLEFL
eukprot:4526966-Lingulodinium_polyedra.AAC.1